MERGGEWGGEGGDVAAHNTCLCCVGGFCGCCLLMVMGGHVAVICLYLCALSSLFYQLHLHPSFTHSLSPPPSYTCHTVHYILVFLPSIPHTSLTSSPSFSHIPHVSLSLLLIPLPSHSHPLPSPSHPLPCPSLPLPSPSLPLPFLSHLLSPSHPSLPCTGPSTSSTRCSVLIG